jgi:hypothetical protein
MFLSAMIVKNLGFSVEIRELEQAKFIYPYLLIGKHISMLLDMIGKRKLVEFFSIQRLSMKTYPFNRKIPFKFLSNQSL